ncbi:hypothetical protein [Thermomonospora cellulosilytica]|uniref:Uncharacterized protein n=1 Tax=Thermomonospora cellulosilytica TaxID=1411118 RepID=A0A7W3RAM5_9ACTN|nr:hypothetical protein [Thermomonospora cellulosilytica]MBA9005849.1 hypothetical protein [Thermomonospora cellulosilytica]
MSYEFPPDLLRLQKQFCALDRRCEELAAELPTGTAIAAGEATLTGPRADEYAKARADRMKTLTEMRNHWWWEGKSSEDAPADPDAPQVRDRAAAKLALQEAARA